ncbi:unnamed protein product [Ilex paraguariensis]|uniref:Uncharacterized protein n=1 Tax=Ilex paraguariensis TaxID=185542 RepID=A0ABC8QTL5_9AQUA
MEMEMGIGESGSPPKPGSTNVLTRSSGDSYPSMVTPMIGGDAGCVPVGGARKGGEGDSSQAQGKGERRSDDETQGMGDLGVVIDGKGTTHKQLSGAKGGGANYPGDTTDKEFLGVGSGGRRLNGDGMVGSKVSADFGCVGDAKQGTRTNHIGDAMPSLGDACLGAVRENGSTAREAQQDGSTRPYNLLGGAILSGEQRFGMLR